VRRLEIAILLKTVKGHESLYWLVPFAIVLVTGLRILTIEKRHDERVEDTNVALLGVRLEHLNQFCASLMVCIG
jgi:hypothetical protein